MEAVSACLRQESLVHLLIAAAGSGRRMGGDRNKLLLEYGDFVNSLQGQYIAAVDYGTTPVDMDVVDQSTTFNVCRSEHDNPATYTAQGVYLSIQTVLHHTQRQISDATITIQGFGSVGSRLASLLVNAGCHVITADVSENHTKQAKSIGIDIAKPNDLLNINADVFAPCAVGGVINKETIRAIGAKSICGAANNQLKDDRHDADRLHQQGIIYCPDFIVNSGGLIYASGCHRNDTAETVQARLNTIPNTLNSVLIDSHNRGLSPYQSALSKLHSHHDLSTSV